MLAHIKEDASGDCSLRLFTSAVSYVNMGQSTSAQSREQHRLPPVQSIDQFQDRVRQLLRRNCLSRQEVTRFRSVFNKFSSASEASPTWNESDLVKFLGVSLPDELKPALEAAGPLLYRCMIRVGSFPYQTQPVSALTADVAMVAVTVLLRRHESDASTISGIGSGDEEEEVRRAEWLRRILFQSMATRDSSATSHSTSRGAADDEDLMRAHKFVSSHNKWRDWERNPKVAHSGPPVIPVSELPSSRSQDLSGSIAMPELEALVKLLLSCQLYPTEDGPEILVREGKELDAGVASIVAALHEPNETSGVTWESFNRAFSESPTIMSGFTRLFAPLVVEDQVSYQHVDSEIKAKAARLLRDAVSASRWRVFRREGVLPFPSRPSSQLSFGRKAGSHTRMCPSCTLRTATSILQH
ncbi:hypothetical protein GGR52DRAFT_536278 [Hypoxylon sp. FL1284]|nr:hypothetical protein GGR52DRAFT_536278 [Hypoxylon sp. FL1284]